MINKDPTNSERYAKEQKLSLTAKKGLTAIYKQDQCCVIVNILEKTIKPLLKFNYFPPKLLTYNNLISKIEKNKLSGIFC